MILKRVIWKFQIYNCLREIQISRFYESIKEFGEIHYWFYFREI